MPQSLKERLVRGEKQIGCIQLLPSADVTEILAYSGIDLIMIDQEHGRGGLADFVSQSRSVCASQTELIVRIPHGDLRLAQRLLDNGATGLVYPGVDTAEEAAAFVEACRYPPRGSRGAGAGLRAARYGLDDKYYLPASEDKVLLVAQIETAKAVENIDAICSVAGIDLLLIGPRDLSASIGKLGDFDNPELWDLVSHAAGRIKQAGKFLGSTLHPGRRIKEMFCDGYDLVLAAKDIDFLMNGASSLMRLER